MKERHKHFSKKDLKNENVGKEIRSRVIKNPISVTVATDNDDEVSRNSWGYAKKVFRSRSSVLSSLNVVHDTTYFTNAMKCLNYMNMLTIPSEIPKLKEPNSPFNLSAPAYYKIRRIIKRIKSSGSPCPLDEISIIFFKRCPYLRSFILNICTEVEQSCHHFDP